MKEKVMAPGHPSIGTSHLLLARILVASGRGDEALARVGARAGRWKLTIIVGGDEDAYRRVEPIVHSAQRAREAGDVT